DHNEPDGLSGQNNFPDSMERQRFFVPVERVFEREIKKRLEYWDRLRVRNTEKE
ncbi:MAG: replication-associated recombination protein A, partial [Kiloniellales bacterium]|nr:replication-associated recombination protein A [Kiloniellales bacterium]